MHGSPSENHARAVRKVSMDKKTLKQIQVLKDRLRNRQQRLAGAKQQADEADEVERIRVEIASIEAALRELIKS